MARVAILFVLLGAGVALPFAYGARAGVADSTTATETTVTATTQPSDSTTIVVTVTKPVTVTRSITTTKTTTVAATCSTPAPTPIGFGPPGNATALAVTPVAQPPPFKATPRHGRHARATATGGVRRAQPQGTFRPPSPPSARNRRLFVVVGLAASLLLCGVASLPFAIVRPRAAAVFVQDHRLEFLLVGAAAFVAVGLDVLLGR